MATALRPMNTGEILDRTFNLYRNNFPLFAGIALLPPALNLALNVSQLLTTQFASGINAVMINGLSSAGLFVVYLLGTIVAAAATVHAVSMVHLGQGTTIGASYRGIQPYFWRLVGLGALLVLLGVALALPFIVLLALSFGMREYAALFGALTALAVLAFIVLGIHFYARFSVSMSALVLEKVGAVQAMRRSMFLTKGASGRIWLMIILTGIIAFAVAFALEIPALLLLNTKIISLFTFRLLIALAGFIAGTVVGPISSISLVLIYYDQRIRKEAFDLQIMMDALGQTNPQQAISATPIG